MAPELNNLIQNIEAQIAQDVSDHYYMTENAYGIFLSLHSQLRNAFDRPRERGNRLNPPEVW